MPTTHVLFDFFGTLVEYSPSRTEQGYPNSHTLLRGAGCTLDYAGFLQLWETVADEFERRAVDSLREYAMPSVVRAFLARCVPQVDDVLVETFTATYLAEWNAGVRYVDGLPGMLERLSQRYRLGLITNTHDDALVPNHLVAMGVADAFELVVTSVGYGLRKPAPEIFAHAATGLAASVHHCVYVGDNLHADFHGARSAGMDALLIDPGGQPGVEPSLRVERVLDVERWLGARGAQSV